MSSAQTRDSVPTRGTYEIREISLADTARLFGFMKENAFRAGFNLKGFDNPWILSSRRWKKGERVLDVGAGYSELPAHIARTYGCEVWVADDFGFSDENPFWRRHQDPSEHIEGHADVRYVLERIGRPELSSLPASYFDCVISVSALEHVPENAVPRVWAHMDRLLRPGGEMLHAVDIALPTSRGIAHVLLSLAFDLAYPVLPHPLRTRFTFETPRAYARAALRALGIDPGGRLRRLDVLNFVLNPEVLLEPPSNTYNRITKDGQASARHFRVGSLLIHLAKTGAEGASP
jgi:SAM-dependent methyltransferase